MAILFLFLTLLALSTSDLLRPTDPDVFEGGCFRKFIPVTESKFTPIYTSLISTFGSQSHFRLLAEAFLGRPATSQEEIDRICHTFILTDVSVTHVAYGHLIYVAKGQLNGFVYDWPHIPLAKSPHVSNLPYVSTIIWTHEDHILFADCFDGRINKWKLVSRKLASAEVKAEVLKQIKMAGFNESLAWDMTNTQQTGHPYHCQLNPASFAETTTRALRGLDFWNDQSEVYKTLPQEVTYNGQGYSKLADYYKALLAPVKTFVHEAIEHCHQGEYESEKRPMACGLFDL